MTYPVMPGDTWSRLMQSSPWLLALNQGINLLRPGIVLNNRGYSPGYSGYAGGYAPRPTQPAPRPNVPLSTPSWWPMSYVNPWQRYTPAFAPRPTGQPFTPAGPRPGPTNTGYGGMPPTQGGYGPGDYFRMNAGYAPVGGQVPWLPPQAYMTPQQWSGQPYRAPVPQNAPVPQQAGQQQPGQQQQFPGSQFPGLPWLPAQAFMTPEQWSGIPPTNYGVFIPPEAGAGGGGGGRGGWGFGRGRGAGGPRRQATYLPGSQGGEYRFSSSRPDVGVDYANMGFIHWRV